MTWKHPLHSILCTLLPIFFLPHIQKKKSLNPLYHKTIKLSSEQINSANSRDSTGNVPTGPPANEICEHTCTQRWNCSLRWVTYHRLRYNCVIDCYGSFSSSYYRMLERLCSANQYEHKQWNMVHWALGFSCQGLMSQPVSFAFPAFLSVFLDIPVSVFLGLFSLGRFIYRKPLLWNEA